MGGGSDEARESRPLAASLSEIGRALEETARALKQHAEAEAAAAAAARAAKPAITVELVRSLVTARRLRVRYFNVGAGGATWTMLLELFAARLEQRRVNQRMLGRIAGVTPTTALRLVRTLAAAGYLRIERDPDCRRNLLIALTDGAAERMTQYLEIALGTAALV